MGIENLVKDMFIKFPKIPNPNNYEGVLEEDFRGFCYFQEKYDGSNFRVMINDNDEWVFGSRNNIISTESGQFKHAVEHFISNPEFKKILSRNTVYFFEYLEKPKHNVVTYKRIPQNHLVLLDAFDWDSNEWFTPIEIDIIADQLNVERIQTFTHKDIKNGIELFDYVKKFISYPSSLGGNMEGIVIKNYENMKYKNGLIVYSRLKVYRDRLENEFNIPISINYNWVDSFIDPDIASKIITKFKDDGKELVLKDLINYTYDDFVEENFTTMKQKIIEYFEKEIKKYIKSKLYQEFKYHL